MLYKSQKAVIKFISWLFFNCIEANYKVIHGKGHPDILARMSRLAKVSDHSYLKILTPKQMLQRLAIALEQEKAGNTFENLLNKVRQMVYFLHRAKEII